MPHHDRGDDDGDEDIDRDPDEQYRRRVDRYGEELTDEEEEEQEKEEIESGRVARKKCLWPGILMVSAGVLTLIGSIAFLASLVIGSGTGAGPGAAGVVLQIIICGGIPALAVLAFSALQTAGGVCLLRQRKRGLVIVGAILGGLSMVVLIPYGLMLGFLTGLWFALVPCFLSIPAAIWMFVALADQDVQEAFERHQWE